MTFEIKVKAKEPFSFNYLIFRDPTEYLLILIPIITGIIASVFFVQETTVDKDFTDSLAENSISLIGFHQEQAINTYLFASKLSIIVLLAFFICYRWSAMQFDGSYGFWLTLGINRTQFFMGTFTRFILLLFFTEIIGLTAVIYISGIILPIFTIVKLVLLVLGSMNIMIGVAMLIANVLNNPELSAMSFMIIFGLNMFFNTNPESILHQIFQSDLQYNTNTAWLSLIMALGFGTLLNFISLRLHIWLDMEI